MIHTLEADSIIVEFGLNRILSDVYIKCETGRITGLLGRNGAGKSSLLNIIYGNLKSSGKSIRFDGLAERQPFKRPELLLYLPQFNFIPTNFSLKRIFADFKVDYDYFGSLFPDFTSKYKMHLGTLSGGERRLVEIYVLVKAKSQFLFLDEPFSHLSPVYVDIVKKLLVGEGRNKGILITDHMYNDVVEISDDLYVLANGKTHLIKNVQEIETLGYAHIS